MMFKGYCMLRSLGIVIGLSFFCITTVCNAYGGDNSPEPYYTSHPDYASVVWKPGHWKRGYWIPGQYVDYSCGVYGPVVRPYFANRQWNPPHDDWEWEE